jgi:hypothetical protein
VTSRSDADRRAARLLRWYPSAWRARYGDEFTELLVADIDEVPASWRRTTDVIHNAMLARMSGAGLTSHRLDPAGQVRASLATLSCAIAAFGTFGLAMLAQLGIGWQWATPRADPTTSGMVIMSGAAAVLGLLVVLAAAPVAWCVAVAMARRGSWRRLAWPAALVLASAVALVAGAHHFQNSWPGTGGTAAHRGIVPAGPAAFSWASTLSVSSYWVHPHALRAFPAGEVAWMALSPLALIGLAAGTAVVVRRLRLPARLLGYEARLAGVAALAMACFLAGAACWVFGQGSGHPGLFHAGAVDVAGLAVMTVAAAAGVGAAVCARRAVAGLGRLGEAGRW